MPEINASDMSEKAAPSGAGSWIKDIKEILQALKGLGDGPISQAPKYLNPLLPKQEQSNLSDIVGLLNQLGLGDMPVGQILERLAPYSVNQMQQMGQNLLSSNKLKGLGDAIKPRK